MTVSSLLTFTMLPEPTLVKIGVLVALESKADKAKLAELGKHIAMHVAASNPLFLNVAAVDPAAR